MFDKISNSCEYVAYNSKHVKIDYKRIDELIKEGIPFGKHWGESNMFNFMDLDIEDIIIFLLFYQSIDFSFWSDKKYIIHTADYGDIDGSQALMYVLVSNINLFKDIDKIRQLSYEDFRNLFIGDNELPLMKERYEIIVNVANIVKRKMNSNFYNYIKDVKNDNELFDIVINNFPSFKDERTFKGKTIYFYKLASLLVSDIMHLRKIKESEDFDYSHIVGCSDYKIPQILRNLGVMVYDKELSYIIDNKIEIDENSEYEVEIRGNTIAVMSYIKDKTGLCGMEINDYFWLMSNKIKSNKPYHRTRTKSY